VVEIVIERWTNPDGSMDFRWSLWRAGHRLRMGDDVHATSECCEKDAREYCARGLGVGPDRITRL
jgi:hypothetical protein